MTVLVTGGAGYIGSHVVRALLLRGTRVVVADDLSAGIPARVRGLDVAHVDLAAAEAPEVIKTVIKKHGVTAVIHLAARKQVGESVEKPEWYYQQNIGGLANLLTSMRESGVDRLVFSSSAATYGMPDVDSVTEDSPGRPINPYGETKLVGEWMVADAAKAWGLRAASLRYFNVAGAGAPELADTALANLIPIVFAAIKAGKPAKVFGTDYPTADGSCVRDYVHVQDLAEAHLAALDYLDHEVREHSVFNVGTGRGYSVLEVLAEVKSVTGTDFEVELAERRPGDPPFLCADVSRIGETLGWQAKRGLREIVETAWSALG
jgi:UDP-glucose 4-epimerase